MSKHVLPHDEPKNRRLAKELISDEALPRLFEITHDPNDLAKQMLSNIEKRIARTEKDADKDFRTICGVVRSIVYEIVEGEMKAARARRGPSPDRA